MRTHSALALALALAATACASKPADPRYPPRVEGCAVQVFHAAPTVPTDNLGSVSASCDDTVSDDACLRTLEDETCKLGGDVVWGVADAPTKADGKIRFSGRAAHTKIRAATAPPPSP